MNAATVIQSEITVLESLLSTAGTIRRGKRHEFVEPALKWEKQIASEIERLKSASPVAVAKGSEAAA